MVAVLVVVLIVMVAVFVVAMIATGRLSAKWAAEQPKFEASLVKNLPPDVQADMKPKRLNVLSFVVIAALAFSITVAGSTATGNVRAILFAGFGLVGAVACAAWAASIAKTWLDRRYPGEVLVDLSPYPLAGAVRRSSWLVWVACAPMLFFGFGFIDFQTAGDWLFGAFWVAFVPLALLTNLIYSDRVWLAEWGLYFGGRLYPWDGFERVAWTDNGLAFALRRRGRWLLKRWIVVPVPEASREAAAEALRRVMAALTPTL